MSFESLFAPLLSPPVLFFFLGMGAAWCRADLRLPRTITKFLSFYLLMAIGVRGGMELATSGFASQTIGVLMVSVAIAALVPLWCFFILRLRLDVENSAAIAATYGSISVVTFLTATACLQKLSIPYSGHMVAAMALMESPAIIVSVLLARYFGRRQQHCVSNEMHWSQLLREALGSGPVVVLLGSLVIGAVTGGPGWSSLKPFLGDPFQGALALFLLDMGVRAAAQLRRLPDSSLFLVLFAVVAAMAHALLGILVGAVLDIGPGDALLLAVLFGSASYIAAPAAARLALPRANPGLYLPMSLGITFPFNVVIGIPCYLAVIHALW